MKQQRFSASLRDAGSVRSISRESRACRHRFSERFPERNSRWVRRARRQKHIPQEEEQHRRRGSEHASSASGTYEGHALPMRSRWARRSASGDSDSRHSSETLYRGEHGHDEAHDPSGLDTVTFKDAAIAAKPDGMEATRKRTPPASQRLCRSTCGPGIGERNLAN